MARPSPLQARVIPSEAFDRIVADEMLERMQTVLLARGRVVVALPFGHTPGGIYERWLEPQLPARSTSWPACAASLAPTISSRSRAFERAATAR